MTTTQASRNFPGNPYADRQPNTEAGGIILSLDTLAYEQRTANLIAYAQVIQGVGVSDNSQAYVHTQILERLGFKGPGK